jgi:hypothetical protein
LALCAPQNVQHLFDVDENTSLIDWEVNTSAGGVNDQPDKFRMNGNLNLKLDAAQAPFTLGQFNGALLVTIPSSLYGEIPNPLPFLPPLATIDVVNLQARVTSGSFTINAATGDFTAMVTLHTTAGTTTLGGLFGSGTTPAFGLVSTPTAIAGKITQNGGTLNLHLDLNVAISQVLSGITVDTSLVGPVDATAQVAAANAFTVSAPVPLISGLTQAITATNGTPGATTFLAGTFNGLGNTPVPALGVTLNLTTPAQIGTAVIAGANGFASWSVTIPTAVIGRSVWFQAAQAGRTTQVAGSYGV